jgi:hypothetical protein
VYQVNILVTFSERAPRSSIFLDIARPQESDSIKSGKIKIYLQDDDGKIF